MRYLIVFSLVFFAPLCWSEVGIADNNCNDKYAAKLVSLQGTLYFDPDSKGQWQPAQLNETICEGSRVRVETHSRASLLLTNGIVLRLDAGTVLSLNGLAPDKPTLLDLFKGFVHFISRTPKRLEITTPIANAGPEGTEFAMSVDDNKASLWVYEGGVRFFNKQGSIQLKPGQGAQAKKGLAPQAKIDIKPQDAVNWALYYPPLLPYPDATTIIDSNIRTAIQDFRLGHVDIALSRLDGLSPEKQTPYFFKIRGAIRLTAGQDKLALQDIRALLANNPNDAEALALQSVLALTQNRKEEAYTLANRAISADPHSATAYSALSYAEQGRFELEKALDAAEHAVKFAPHDAMVWARKAELELSQGLASESKETARHALGLDATLERTQTVTGFAYLLRMDTDEALETFEKAVRLDSTSPLARLGLGLAKIRNGDLEEGRQDLEIAAILDPGNSLVRSYLGKAYYEERRSSLAEDQFSLAKQRDPKDPTPHFYDAINKQTTNRPVEALHDMQKAKELNDNRAVYRSSLLLDKDLAARSAAQGRIYNELGFQQQGLLEGWKSVNRDQSNFSAHRLLADNYAALPRHEIARVSELLQSQLLQPVNITPIQSNLAESNLFILNGLGPSDLSYNEFNPLFEYNRFAFQTSGLYGSNNTWGDNATLSGLHDNVSFSLGQFHYETDGFRENNFLNKDLYNAFLQAQVTNDLNLQAEYRHEERKNGDLALNFDLKNFSEDFKERRNIDIYRLGGRYKFNPYSSLIASLFYQNINLNQERVELIPFPGNPLRIHNDISLERKGFISELQHNYTNLNFSSITGFGHINQQVKIATNNSEPDITDLTRTNIYNYTKYNFSKKLIATLGVSVDFFAEGDEKSTPLNPKFGIEWNPFSSTTFRAAAFRNLSVTRTANQTIEPTQVAGFNQFFDDINGTVAWRYGVGVDQKFSKNIAIGAEYSERKLYIPGNLSGVDRSELLARAYLNFTPHDMVALSTEYFYEKIDQPGRGNTFDNTLNGGLFDIVETHRVPVALSFFHSSGLSFKIKNTFVHQSGIFQNPNDLSLIQDDSNFFVVDLNLSYRLPSRHGIITLGINNLFDDQIHYQNTNSNETILAPSRILFSRLNLAF